MVRAAQFLGPLQGDQPTLPAPARRTLRVPAQPRALALASDLRSSLAVHLLDPGRLLAADDPSTSPYTANALLPMSVSTYRRGFCHGSRWLFLPVGARRPGVGVPHAPVGVAKHLCYCSPDAISPATPTTQAPPRAETLCGPHHQAALRRLCTHERLPPTRPCSPTPAHRHDTRTPPSDRHFAPFLPQSRLCLSGLGRLGQSPCQWSSQWWLLAATVVHRLSPLFSRDPRHTLLW